MNVDNDIDGTKNDCIIVLGVFPTCVVKRSSYRLVFM